MARLGFVSTPENFGRAPVPRCSPQSAFPKKIATEKNGAIMAVLGFLSTSEILAARRCPDVLHNQLFQKKKMQLNKILPLWWYRDFFHSWKFWPRAGTQMLSTISFSKKKATVKMIYFELSPPSFYFAPKTWRKNFYVIATQELFAPKAWSKFVSRICKIWATDLLM